MKILTKAVMEKLHLVWKMRHRSCQTNHEVYAQDPFRSGLKQKETRATQKDLLSTGNKMAPLQASTVQNPEYLNQEAEIEEEADDWAQDPQQ